MASPNILTPDQLRQLVSCDPEKGTLYWTERSIEWFADHRYSPKGAMALWNLKYAGKRCPVSHSGGYEVVVLLGRQYRVHRIIWCLTSGDWPADQIDTSTVTGQTTDCAIFERSLMLRTSGISAFGRTTPAAQTG